MEANISRTKAKLGNAGYHAVAFDARGHGEGTKGNQALFRVYDRMSYGLIVAAEMPVRIADVVRTP